MPVLQQRTVPPQRTLRRSSRIPVQVPIHVTSLEPEARFSEVCETLVVNAHGCALRLPIPLNAGSPLHLHSREGRQATAYVVACEPLGSDGEGWRLGARLDRPENFWGLKACPDDWRVLEMPSPAALQGAAKLAPEALVVKKPQASRPSQAFLDKIEEQLSEERLLGILGKLVRPLQAEVNEIREKLARQARQNRFEVSLGQIPPELEEKLWERLRQEVGARVLEQAREQSAEILTASKVESEQKIGAALTEFRHRLSGELHTVEQRAQALSKELTTTARQQSHAGIEKLQQQALDTGAQISAEGAKVLSSLERRLVETHDAHRREIEQAQTDAAAKASQLQLEVAGLGRRIGTLNDSVRRLESDLDAHLERIAGEIVAEAQSRLQNGVALALKDFQSKGANEVELRLDEVCGHLRTIQNRIENSFSGSLETQGDEAVQSIAQQFEELAEQAMERWRMALADDLNSFAKSLGQKLREECAMEDVETNG
ncbi:MAG: hypothetical protein WBW53_18915 [Terriglobales bacterium]